MGRVSRHKKLKSCDPFYRGPRKHSSEKLVVFSEKEDELEEQKIPRAAKEMMRKVAQGKVVKKGKQQRPTGKETATKPRLTIKFQRNAGESKKQYFNRIDQEAAQAIANNMKESRELRGSRKRHLKKRREKLKDKRKEKVYDDNPVSPTDEVKFGEVVQHPPVITAKPRKAPQNQGSRTLLLNALMKKGGESAGSSSDSRKGSGSLHEGAGPPRVKKRKNMTPHEKAVLDEERERAIAAYRLTKGHKKLPFSSVG